jgi:hypothetical protein
MMGNRRKEAPMGRMNGNAERWAEALEGGGFSQARGSLRHGDSYCCLGVACELYRRETGRGAWEEAAGLGGGSMFFVLDGERDNAVLPEAVARWLGMRRRSSGYGGRDQLSADNDSGKTFPEIARIIRTAAGLFGEYAGEEF